jgi:hypothetical protein
MSGPFASVNGVRITKGSLTIPIYGAWAADFELATDDPMPAAATVAIGNLTLAGTALRTAPFVGAREWRGVAGAHGWPGVLQPRAYGNSAVMLSMVLSDAASELGEQVNVQQDVSLGPGYTRPLGMAGPPTGAELLYQLGVNWWIDNAGVTQIGTRTTQAIAPGTFQVLSQRAGLGLFDVATEDYASWVPGSTFTAPTVTGTVTVSSVTFRLENDGVLRLAVLGVGEGVS